MCFDFRDVDTVDFTVKRVRLIHSVQVGLVESYLITGDPLIAPSSQPAETSQCVPSEKEVRWPMNIHVCASQTLCQKGLSLVRTRERLIWRTKDSLACVNYPLTPHQYLRWQCVWFSVSCGDDLCSAFIKPLQM